MDIKKLPAVTKELFSIPGYVFLCLGSALEYFVITAAMAFFPKVIYVLFNTPLTELSWLYGTAVVLPILGGQILGKQSKRIESNRNLIGRGVGRTLIGVGRGLRLRKMST